MGSVGLFTFALVGIMLVLGVTAKLHPGPYPQDGCQYDIMQKIYFESPCASARGVCRRRCFKGESSKGICGKFCVCCVKSSSNPGPVGPVKLCSNRSCGRRIGLQSGSKIQEMILPFDGLGRCREKCSLKETSYGWCDGGSSCSCCMPLTMMPKSSEGDD